MKTKAWSNWPVRILLLIYSVIVIYPLFWTVTTSFKTTNEFYDNPWSLPTSFSIANYVNAFEKANIGSYFFNSIVVTIGALAICITISFMAAYVITRYDTRWLRGLRKLYMLALFFPIAFKIVPLFMLLNQLHLLDNRFGLILVYAATSIPFTVFLMIGFLSTISKDYEEAAMIDGCSRYGILFRIILPMAQSGLITVVIFNFMSYWNEYIMALSFITTEGKRTLTLGIAYLMEVQRYATDWGALFAALVIVMVPTLLLYSLLQRKITSGLNMGGLKG
ncbi:sugar ABC transporter permease [Paenibacillus sp. J31TS4]|uniref:carbohydrate ABC transporter permease n=1 Tax=Paenibacillus sp. J31TS4 TaxID=2807195 RepID=UPI001B2CFFBC|nr:carbohydrate ABC transporter permease [Paenibacillus sp. J31TS4]GIP39818.1 sugar ABC transporter permease [Paenibacillus sp. J31TS4]